MEVEKDATFAFGVHTSRFRLPSVSDPYISALPDTLTVVAVDRPATATRRW
jgi:hypothetical protein